MAAAMDAQAVARYTYGYVAYTRQARMVIAYPALALEGQEAARAGKAV
jgi:hypothetical protein